MPCDWPIDRSGLPPLPPANDPGYAAALATQNAAEDLAVAVLWALSGRQYGVCPTTVRPCVMDDPFFGRWHRWGYGYGGVTSYLLSWEGNGWVNWGCGCLGSRCKLTGPRMVHLTGPVQSIDRVTIGGVVQDPATYKQEGNVLYRIGAIWPRQDLGRPLGEPMTWSVDYQRGIPVPAGVDKLTGLLALEFMHAAAGSNKCRLPRNVTAVARNGVTYMVYDPATFYESGKTGLAEIDMWLAAINPHHIMQAPSVL